MARLTYRISSDGSDGSNAKQNPNEYEAWLPISLTSGKAIVGAFQTRHMSIDDGY